MADFGGYDMPLWYDTGVKNEHLGVLKSAGIFDTSHMACVSVQGPDAFALLNFCFTRDLAPLALGRCVYGAFLDEKGHCQDDAIVYKFSDTDFMVCVNAGMGGAIARHLSDWKKDWDVTVADLTDKVAKMDIQGVNAARILSKLIQSPDQVFLNAYFSFKGHFDPNHPDADNVKLLNALPAPVPVRYTASSGLNLIVPDAIVDLWKSAG